MEVKILQIVNFEKFRNKILSLGNTVEIAKAINVVPSVISNWIGSARRNIKSEYIERLQSVYKLTLDDLGAEEVEIEIPTISVRLKQLLKENNMNQTELAEILKIANSNISQWKTGDRNPTINDLQKIALYFDVSIEYLLGISNIRNFEITEMSNELQTSEYFIKYLKSDTPSALRMFMGNYYTAEELEEKYFDLKDEVFGDALLLSTLKAECDRVISYYTSSNYYHKYEDCINETDIIGQTQEQPVRRDIESLSHLNIDDALNNVFDEYVDIQLTKIYKEKYKDRYNGNKTDKQVTAEIKQGIAGIFLKNK